MTNTRYTNPLISAIVSTLGALAFFYACMQLAGCSTTRILRNTPAGSQVETSTRVAGVYSSTEIVEQSREQYRDCIQTRNSQAQTSWFDNQQICFGQTTLGQGFGSTYGYNSQQYWGGMNYFGQNYLPGWNMMPGYGVPGATAYPNMIMSGGRPIVIPGGANIHDDVAGPVAAMRTMAMEDLRQRAAIASQPQWPVATQQQTVVVASATTPAPQQGFVVTQEMWSAMTRQVAHNANRRH